MLRAFPAAPPDTRPVRTPARPPLVYGADPSRQQLVPARLCASQTCAPHDLKHRLPVTPRSLSHRRRVASRDSVGDARVVRLVVPGTIGSTQVGSAGRRAGWPLGDRTLPAVGVRPALREGAVPGARPRERGDVPWRGASRRCPVARGDYVLEAVGSSCPAHISCRHDRPERRLANTERTRGDEASVGLARPHGRSDNRRTCFCHACGVASDEGQRPEAAAGVPRWVRWRAPAPTDLRGCIPWRGAVAFRRPSGRLRRLARLCLVDRISAGQRRWPH
jgi:hypothetical protein